MNKVYFSSTYRVFKKNIGINLLKDIESQIDKLSLDTSCNIKKYLSLPNLKCIIASSLGYVDNMEPKWDLLSNWLRTVYHLDSPPLIVSNTCCSSIDALEISRTYIQSCKYDYIFMISFDFMHDFIIKGLKNYDLLAKNKMGNGLSLTSSIVCTLLSVVEVNNPSCAEILSCNVLNDASSITSIDSSGKALKLAIKKTMNEVGISTNDLHSILVAYNGINENDIMINAALSTILIDDRKIQVVKSKSKIGHSLGSSGILEISIYIDKLMKIRFNEQRQEIYLLYVSAGFSGVVSAMVFKL